MNFAFLFGLNDKKLLTLRQIQEKSKTATTVERIIFKVQKEWT